MRCPQCEGLRSIAYRNRGTAALCKDCRSGRIVTRRNFFGWWEERFSSEEIREMGKAIWG